MFFNRQTDCLDRISMLCCRYEHQDIALTCGMMLRECCRHEELARIVLHSDKFYNFFTYVEMSTFDIASDAFSTFKVRQNTNSGASRMVLRCFVIDILVCIQYYICIYYYYCCHSSGTKTTGHSSGLLLDGQV